MSWNTLKKQIEKCDACKLRKSCTQVVSGDGNPEATVAIIGEGPGETEDEQGLPFVGASGRFLRREMRFCALPEDDVFILNIVKCRPPENRDPEPEEVEACWPWTEKTLATIRPKVIVALGAVSLSTLAYRYGFSKKLGSQLKITAVAGRPVWVEDRHFYVYPMFHPAFAMRSRARRNDFRGHMKFLVTSLPGWLLRP